MAQSQLVLAFAQALTELVTVEKKNIMALTDIAREALLSEPQSAPNLAALITNRIVQAPVPQKLPVLYLLDSISKLVGEPYKTLFVPALPEVYMNAWHFGGPGLQRPLEKLLGTWAGVFPTHVLADIQGRLAALRASQASLQPAGGPNGYGGGGYGYAAVVPAPAFAPPPMAADPRLVQPQAGYGQPMPYQQQPSADPYSAPYQAVVPPQQPAFYQQPQQQQRQPEFYQQPPAGAPLQQQQPGAPQVSVPDLLSSLVNAGLLSAPGAQPAAAPLVSGGSGVLATPPYAAAATSTPPYPAAATPTPEPEQPATTHFSPDQLKERNPSAVSRLLRQTEATKSRFLDRKFLRRQQKAAGASARASRLWYLDIDTWMASTTGAANNGSAGAAGSAAGRGGQPAQQAAPAQKHSVPVDDAQTHCALSGEPFEQFWDEEHQEWRYRDAKALDAEEAASYGLQEGAIVLISALGKPAASVLQQGGAVAAGGAGAGGIVAEMHAQQEIAADLAAAAATAGGGAAESVHATELTDEKPSLKHPLQEDSALADGAQLPQEKRARVS